MIEDRIDRAKRLLALGDAAGARAELAAAADWLLRLLWARLPDRLPPAQRALVAAVAQGTGGDRFAPASTEVRRLVRDADLVRHAETLLARKLPALRRLPEAAAGLERAADHPPAAGPHTTAGGQAAAPAPTETTRPGETAEEIDLVRMAATEVREALGDRFQPVVLAASSRPDEAPASGSEDGAGARPALAAQHAADHRGRPSPPPAPPLPDPAERTVAKLHAQGREALHAVLLRLLGMPLQDRYRLESLIDIGGQSVVFKGVDLGRQGCPVVVKIARLDYDRPAAFGTEEVRRARAGLRRGWEMLRLAPRRWFPEPIALVVGRNPLHLPQRPRWVLDEELFLVEDFVPGMTLVEFASRFHGAKGADGLAVQRLIGSIGRQLLEAFVALAEQNPPLRYTDLAPRNVMVRSPGEVRLVDASSVVRTSPPESSAWTTRTYLPARCLEAVDRREPVDLDDAALLYGLGKCLHYVVTNREPLEGTDPSLDDLRAVCRDPELGAFIEGLCRGAFRGFPDALAAVQAFADSSGPPEE
jgi:hypothetical protein